MIPALASIGLLHVESNGNYEFSRNGLRLVFPHPRQKTLDIEDIIKIRHFLRDSAHRESIDPQLNNTLILAVDYHKTLAVYNPTTDTQEIEKILANLSNGRILHKRPQTPPFHDSDPMYDPKYFEAVIHSMTKASRVVVLSHGTGSSSAAERLVEITTKKHPELLHKIVAMKKCDLEAMTEAQLIALGTELLQANDA